MNEQERADWLARAVDRLIQSRGAPETPSGLDDDELEGLMRVAQARLESAQSIARAGLQHEGAVWEKVLRRLEEHQEGAAHQSGATTHFRKRAGNSGERSGHERRGAPGTRRDGAPPQANGG